MARSSPGADIAGPAMQARNSGAIRQTLVCIRNGAELRYHLCDAADLEARLDRRGHAFRTLGITPIIDEQDLADLAHR